MRQHYFYMFIYIQKMGYPLISEDMFALDSKARNGWLPLTPTIILVSLFLYFSVFCPFVQKTHQGKMASLWG